MPGKRPVHYETVLRIRKRQEELRAMALAGAQREVRAAELERDSLTALRGTTLAEAGAKAQRRFDAGEVRLYYQYERHLDHLTDNKVLQLGQLSKVAEERRQELDDAMKKRRIIEKLIEHAWDRYKAEVLKAEQQFSDEVASNYAAMRRLEQNKAR